MCSICSYDYLQLFEGTSDQSDPSQTFTGQLTPGTTFTSATSAILLRFISDYVVTGPGFRIQYESGILNRNLALSMTRYQ